MMKRIKSYGQALYELRYFIIHMVRLNLRNKFRRSKLGLLWTFISPLCLTLIMAFVFSSVFHNDILTYTPYILTGMLFWEVLTSGFIAGGTVIISNQFFIRQCSHPYSVYTLIAAIVYIITFIIACISLICWLIFVDPVGILFGLLFLLPAAVFYFAMAWSATTIAAYTCAKYRDYPMMAPLMIQALWYVSPVFFEESMFKSNPYLYAFFTYNPITRLLNLIRLPFLHNQAPSLSDYGISLLFILILSAIAYRVSQKNGREIIFYL